MNATPRAPLGSLLLRQRLVVAGGLIAVVGTSWLYLLALSRDMAASPGMAPPSAAWLLSMWIVMMAAMMFPTAAPMIVAHARFQRGLDPARSPAPRTALFALGYGVAWTGFAALATAAHVGLERAAAMRPMAMALAGGAAPAAVLVAAGLFQMSPLKNTCLRQCRSPVGFFMTSWRGGRGGALAMGLHHGMFCVGCCWALMAVMFVVGAMNMLWAAALTLFVLLEKVGPRPRLVTHVSGLALIAAGGWLLASA